MKQLNLSESLSPGKEKSKILSKLEPRFTHGGLESKGKRKTARPFSPQSPQHIVLKSKRANGAWSMKHRKHQSKITSMVYVYASRFRVHVYRFANVGNHLHLLVKAADKKDLADYLRVLAGRVAVTVSGARKHVKRIGKFWDHLCWSRLVRWGKEFHFVDRSLLSNELKQIDLKYKTLALKNPNLIPKPT